MLSFTEFGRQRLGRLATGVTAAAIGVLGLGACPPAERNVATPAAGPTAPTPGLGPAETVPTGLPGPEACADAPLITLAELARGERDGERVAVDVVPQAMVRCTALACYSALDGRPAQPEACCNECRGGYGWEISGEFHLAFADLGGCSGHDCNLRCEPFGRAPTRAYRLVGTSSRSPRDSNGAVYDTAVFTVERYCATGDATPSTRSR